MKLSISLNRIMFFGWHSIERTPSIEFSVLKIYIFPIQMRTLKRTIRPGRHYQRLCPPLNYTSASRHACIHLLASLALSSSSLFLSRARIYARSHRVYIERGRAVLFLLAPLSLSLDFFVIKAQLRYIRTNMTRARASWKKTELLSKPDIAWISFFPIDPQCACAHLYTLYTGRAMGKSQRVITRFSVTQKPRFLLLSCFAAWLIGRRKAATRLPCSRSHFARVRIRRRRREKTAIHMYTGSTVYNMLPFLNEYIS